MMRVLRASGLIGVLLPAVYGLRAARRASFDVFVSGVQVRVENERLRLQLQELQHRVLGKSPRGRDGDGTQLVLDLLHKDLAAAKAQNHILQAEISSMADHCKRIQAGLSLPKAVF